MPVLPPAEVCEADLSEVGRGAFENAKACWGGLIGRYEPRPELAGSRMYWLAFWWDQCEIALAEWRFAEMQRGKA
jgi:hypothetical protein